MNALRDRNLCELIGKVEERTGRHMVNDGVGDISHSLVSVKHRSQKNGRESARAVGWCN